MAATYLRAQGTARDSLPAHYSVLSQRGSVRILRYLAGPGDKTAMHVHPSHFAYVVRGGQVRFTFRDGQARDVALVAGQQFDIPRPLWHAIEVTGSDSILVLLVEDLADSSRQAPAPHGSASPPPNEHLLQKLIGRGVAPVAGARVFPFLMASGIAELSFSAWLLVVGVNAQRWNSRPPAHSRLGRGGALLGFAPIPRRPLLVRSV
ncbi:MAG: hypothetical protein MNPFHGCM_03264 [Gemmatimonadaceae bacterium]|nr:hypothetical protein [Gemmatimonadaceae bacterium]